MLDALVPVDQLPRLCDVSDRTIRRWIERDEVATVWIRNEATNGRKAIRRHDIPESWGFSILNTHDPGLIGAHMAAHMAAQEAERERWRRSS